MLSYPDGNVYDLRLHVPALLIISQDSGSPVSSRTSNRMSTEYHTDQVCPVLPAPLLHSPSHQKSAPLPFRWSPAGNEDASGHCSYWNSTVSHSHPQSQRNLFC